MIRSRRPLLSRRLFVGGIASAPLLLGSVARAADAKKIAALFAGSTTDRGFMQAGFQGLRNAAESSGSTFTASRDRLDGLDGRRIPHASLI